MVNLGGELWWWRGLVFAVVKVVNYENEPPRPYAYAGRGGSHPRHIKTIRLGEM